MKDLITLAINTAQVNGASYSDARIVINENQSISVKNGKVEEISTSIDQGIGVRVIKNGAWGFSCNYLLGQDNVQETAKEAVKIAEASSLIKKDDIVLDDSKTENGRYISSFIKDPFAISLEEKLDILLQADKLLSKDKRIKVTSSGMDFFRKKIYFQSSEGSIIEQEITKSGAGISATAVNGEDLQVRSYPNSFRGDFAQRGYEFIESMDLVGNAERVADEALTLLQSPVCPSKETTIVLLGNQLALQVHESIGHPIELDRILGTEASFAGTSFLSPSAIDNFRYGSEIVNITADATIKDGLGSFGFDDEGVPAQRIVIIKNGKLKDFLTSRETALKFGKKSNGTMRADGWNRIPLIRMTNINLEPGDISYDEMIGEIDDGLIFDTVKSWSIDDKRLNFQFAVEMAREIKNGQLGKIYKNANYTGITPKFWESCDAISDSKNWKVWGVSNCGKGEPMQIAHVGHGCSEARFNKVQVGAGR